MRLVDSKQPFHKRYEFKGRFELGADVTEPVDVVIDFDELNNGPIYGIVIGDAAAAHKVHSAFDWPQFCQLVSVGDEGQRFLADRVHITKLSPGGRPGVAAEFRCGSVSETLPGGGHPDRGISFDLAGSLGALAPHDLIISSWTGARTLKEFQSDIDLGVVWNGKVELRNSYFWEEVEGFPKQGRHAHVPCLRLTSDASEADLSDEALLAEATELVDDATLLMSVACRRWVAWYGYTYWTPRALVHYRGHSSREIIQERHRIDDSPVGVKHREFLKVALPRFRERRASGEDLRLAIVYSIPKDGSRYVEEKFAGAFWGLEKLIDLFSRRADRAQVVSDGVFKKTKRVVEAALGSNLVGGGAWGDSTVSLGLMRQKLLELNRPSIAEQLAWLCHHFDVEWRDLYPESLTLERPEFIKTRNKIFHSNTAIDGAMVLRETYRVSLVFERLLLRALGWDDLGGTRATRTEIPITDEL